MWVARYYNNCFKLIVKLMKVTHGDAIRASIFSKCATYHSC